MFFSFQVHSDVYVARLQRSFAGACVAVLLVTGLVASPTMCACGTNVPHSHSLFILAGHHHGVDGVHFGGAREGEHSAHHKFDSSPATGPQLTGRISHGSERVAVTLEQIDAATITWQRFSQPATVDALGDGRVEPPDSPPPRTTFPV